MNELEETQSSGAFRLGPHEIGKGKPCLIIGEVAQAHDGSLGMAHSLIDAFAEAGADAIKFQTHLAEAESSPDEPWRVKFSKQDKSRFDYWKRMEFTPDQWQGLREHCDDKGVLFLSSAFSPEAVDILEQLGNPAWKIASGEVNNLPLLRKMIETKKPIIFSSGMSSEADLNMATDLARSGGVPFSLLQCTTAYPTTPEKIGLNQLRKLHESFTCPVGLSDHSGEIFPGIAAVAQGYCSILEVHITFHKRVFGPDAKASLDLTQFEELVKGVRFVEIMNANPVDKNDQAREAEPMKALFTKSLVARKDIDIGTILSEKDIACKKPGLGIPSERLEEFIGRKTKRRVLKGVRFEESDIE